MGRHCALVPVLPRVRRRDRSRRTRGCGFAVTAQVASDPHDAAESVPDVGEPLNVLLRDLGTSGDGLSEREAVRRLLAHGPNLLPQSAGRPWIRDVLTQLTHPLALLLWAAAALSLVASTPTLALAIVGVVLLNAAFALAQEHQAERAVEALSAYVPRHATVVRDGLARVIEATALVAGDVLAIEEGQLISADARLFSGAVEVDMSALTGESVPVLRCAGGQDVAVRPLDAPDMVFSGTLCTAGTGRAVVFATGGRTEIGRIATLSSGIIRDASPLEKQVKHVAWLIAVVAVVVGIAFVPLGLVAGLSVTGAAVFAIGLLVANVPEGLLPTITLALAVGVRELARHGAVVKRLSAVETLGSTTVVCTDKTGTLTENRMRGAALWTQPSGRGAVSRSSDPALLELTVAAARCTTVAETTASRSGDPTELAIVDTADVVAGPGRAAEGAGRREAILRFDPGRRLMSVVYAGQQGFDVVVKGAPEAVLARCRALSTSGGELPINDPEWRAAVHSALEELTGEGLRVLAVARRHVTTLPQDRDEVEIDLVACRL
jgi:magnesium-transporting ATPase (P-type)